MKRCVVKLDAKKAAKKVSRWNTIALSAAKQAKRGIIPEVREMKKFQRYFRRSTRYRIHACSI